MYLVHSVTGVTVTMIGEDLNLVRWMNKMGYEEVVDPMKESVGEASWVDELKPVSAEVLFAALEPVVEEAPAPKTRKPRKTASKE